MKLSDFSITEWVKENNIKTSDGKRMYFDGDRRFLFAPMSDLSPQQCHIKGAQMGASESFIVKMFKVIQMFGLNVIYTFPTADLMKKFTQGKINPIIENNPVIANMVTNTDNVHMKRIGQNNLVFTGAENESQAIAFSSDLNIHDEIDSSNQKIIKQFKARQQASKLKWQWLFSHPSLPEVGVHAAWERSDQKHWFITCKECQLKQYLSWPDSINVEKQIFQCKKCKAELTNNDRQVGKWVAKYKMSEQRVFSGWWIPLLLAPWVSAKEIIEYSNGDQYTFFTRVLGIPYSTGGDKINVQQILRNCTDDINKQGGNIVIGVDTGLPIYYEIMNDQGVFYYGKCEDYDALEALLIRFPRAIMVIDQGGDLIGSRKLREKFKNRVFLCHYRRDRKTMQLIKWGEGEEMGNVVVDRNRMIQLCVDEMRDGLVPLFGNQDDWEEYALHWAHIYRIAEENSLGVMDYKWERFDSDHWVHAHVYARVGMSKYANGDGKVFVNGTKSLPASVGHKIEQGTVSFDPTKKFIFNEQKVDDWRSI